VKHSALDPPSDKPNFQALLYLTQHRTEYLGEELQFTFFHFLQKTLDDVVTGDGNLDDCLTTVTYHPSPSRSTSQAGTSSPNCKRTRRATATRRSPRPSMRVPCGPRRTRVPRHAGQRRTHRLRVRTGVDRPDDRQSWGLQIRHKWLQTGHSVISSGFRNRNYFTDDIDAFRGIRPGTPRRVERSAGRRRTLPGRRTH